MECPLSEELQKQLEIKLVTVDYKTWNYHAPHYFDGHTLTLYLSFRENRRGELIGDFQHLGYTATRCGLSEIIDVMAKMNYAPAVTYLRIKTIDSILEDLS